MTFKDLSTRSWRSLSPQEKRNRLLVVSLLDRVRRDEAFSFVMEDLGISMDIILKHASPYL